MKKKLQLKLISMLNFDNYILNNSINVHLASFSIDINVQ